MYFAGRSEGCTAPQGRGSYFHRAIRSHQRICPEIRFVQAQVAGLANTVMTPKPKCHQGFAHYGSHDAVIRVYDTAGKVIETDEHKGHFKKGRDHLFSTSLGALLKSTCPICE